MGFGLRLSFGQLVAGGGGAALPTFSTPDVTGAPTGFTVDSDIAGSCWWNVSTSASESAATVQAGAGEDSGSGYVIAGTNSFTMDLSAATPDTYYVHTTNGATVWTSASFEITASSTAAQIVSLLGAKLLVLLDVTDFANLKQDTAGTTAVTAATDPVRYIADVSGNGNHFTATSNTSPGNAIAQSGYVDWNSAGFIPDSAITGLTTTSEFHALIETGSDNFALIGHSTNFSAYAGIVEDGGASAMHQGTGTPTYTVSNSAISPQTRNQFHDDLEAGGFLTAGAQAVDLSGMGSTVIALGYTSGLRYVGDTKYIVITTALTAGERSDLETLLAGEA